MKVLFFLRSINYDRHFEAVLGELLERGHAVHVAFDVEKKGRQGDSTLFDALRARHPALTTGMVPSRRDTEVESIARELRLAIDYLRYLEPEYAHAEALRDRARERAWDLLVRLAGPPGAPPARHRALAAVLRAAERALPVPEELIAYVREQAPDVVMVSPLVGLGSPQGDAVRAAQAAGVPVVLAVASWDNLTNKGVLREVPDRTLVWNEAQVAEAVDLHALPAERVEATGAHTYDQWFARTPSTTREAFCERAGLDPASPLILYVGSSKFIAPDEASFVARWVRALRASPDPRLRDASILVRPHPANPQDWEAAGVEEPGRTVVWPKAGAVPTTADAKADYFDSIHHCAAVVGINTSALIESSILGRPVLTLLDDEFRDTQEGTLHFAHIGDMLVVARSWDEHLAQLAAAVEGDPETPARMAAFVRRFVRPHGVDVAATPRMADAIEAVAAQGREASVAGSRDELVRRALTGSARLARTVNGRRRASRRGRALVRPSAERRLRVVMVLDHPGLLIHFDETVRELARRGHRVTLGFARPDRFRLGLEGVLDPELPKLTADTRPVPQRLGAFAPAARRVRAAMDLLHYHQPGLRAARYSRAKWARNPDLPRWLPRLVDGRVPLAPGVLRRAFRALRALEAAIPSDVGIERWLAARRPDVVVVSPLVNQRAYQTDYLKAASVLGLHSALCVASWDNLTSKGRIRALPERVTVWNRTQQREAVELHGVPAERIAVTGAQPFDRWFGREAASDRATFCSEFGLDPERAVLLFVGSTQQGQRPGQEVELVRDWVRALRASEDERVRTAGVLVRPHPTGRAWDDVDVSDLEGVVVWRRERPLPVLADDRAAYFDALAHADAMIGINSSAMVEAAILGLPVHALCLPEWTEMQDALVHFGYLRESNGGFLREAATLSEHVERLASDLRDGAPAAALDAHFVEHFLRPHGRDVPATGRLVEELERLGRAARPAPRRASLAEVLLRGPLAVASLIAGAIDATRALRDVEDVPRAEALRRRAKRMRREADEAAFPSAPVMRVGAAVGLRVASWAAQSPNGRERETERV